MNGGGGGVKRRRRKNPNTEVWVRRIYGLKFQIPVGKRYLGTGKVRDFCIRQQFLPAAAAEIPLRTVYRVARELKLSPWKMGLGGG